jgi:hypothetical protein
MRQHHGRAFQGSLTVIVLGAKAPAVDAPRPSNPSRILPMHQANKKSQASPRIREKLDLVFYFLDRQKTIFLSLVF